MTEMMIYAPKFEFLNFFHRKVNIRAVKWVYGMRKNQN